ncbi:DNA mismatch endonuclease Vsr [Pseudoalteromonas rubra]|uniref:Very short patch repair endonuclease n=1 Tax=Pseudoalteromonas rubra TaxID=43658 RepID=A0A5S3US78_9GAMM|nr:very short patch repair endonuclease [Pseudoalteromonas rubra]QPB84572.1 DNA mismatch endonuclease Vsr [Pseudoalteromonas rubra]
MDVHDKQTRSKNMRAIRSKNTKPELLLRRLLHKEGLRYRVCPKAIPGKPDIWLRKYNAAIFVHGCFWHMHGCAVFKLPQTRQEFWKSKLESNFARDKVVQSQLRRLGIRVLVVWECSLKGKNRLAKPMINLLVKTWLVSGSSSGELTEQGLYAN